MPWQHDGGCSLFSVAFLFTGYQFPLSSFSFLFSGFSLILLPLWASILFSFCLFSFFGYHVSLFSFPVDYFSFLPPILIRLRIFGVDDQRLAMFWTLTCFGISALSFLLCFCGCFHSINKMERFVLPKCFFEDDASKWRFPFWVNYDLCISWIYRQLWNIFIWLDLSIRSMLAR